MQDEHLQITKITPTEIQKPNLQFGGTPSYIATVGTGRRMKAYCLIEHELDAIADANTQAAKFSAIGWSFLSFAGGLVVQVILQGWSNLSAFAQGFVGFGIPAAILAGSWCLYHAKQQRERKQTILTTMKAESFPLDG